MYLLREGIFSRIPLLVMIAIFVTPVLACAQDLKVFKSDEYGFTMKYPGSWVKIDKPKGNYYVVFQAPEMTENFRSRIHVAAHKPVKDPVNVFLQELRKGIKDLQTSAGGEQAQQEVKILDEGEFKCEVPGAYFFFIQAYESKLKLWMDIVIVFYKFDQTLLRISCLAPSKSMDKFHGIFNEVLTSVKFGPAAAGTAPAPSPGAAEQPRVAPPPVAAPRQPIPPAPTVPSTPPPSTTQPTYPAPPAPTTPAPPSAYPAPAVPAPAPTQVSPPTTTQPTTQPENLAQPTPAPRSGPRGPLRGPEKPGTGIVE